MATHLTFDLEPVREAKWLPEAWQKLEEESDSSFFISWAWIGTWLAELPEAFEPLCLSAREGANLVALSIWTPRRVRRHGVVNSRQLHLHTTGDPTADRLTIEYNGLLTHRRAPQEIATNCLDYLFAEQELCDELYLDGMAPFWRDVSTKLAGHVLERKISVCPYVDLRMMEGETFFDRLGPNTRHQIRRSQKLYGAIEIQIADDLTAARRIWDELRNLHQDYWHSQGEAGAFDAAIFEPFHQRLITEHLAAGRVQLIRISGSQGTIGCLYNFVHRGRVYAYQSGFRYSQDNRLKPGLVSHVEAIEFNRRLGHEAYDFLAGDARYKRSLSNNSNELLWLVLQRRTGALRLENRLRDLKARLLSACPDREP